MQHAGLGVADEDRTIGQAGPGFGRREAVELEPADMAIVGAAALDGLGEFLEGKRGRRAGHDDVLDQCRALRKTRNRPRTAGLPRPVWPRQGGPKQRWWALRLPTSRKEPPMADPETPATNPGPVTISSSSSERAPIIYFDGASCF